LRGRAGNDNFECHLDYREGVAVLGRIACTLFLIGVLTPSLAVDGAAQSRRKAKGGGATAQQAIGKGCKSSLMSLVEGGVAVARGCLVGQNQWRFWCSDGSLFNEGHRCTISNVATVQAPEGDGCKSALMPLVENGVTWGKGCSIGTNRWRFWCSSGRVYDEIQPDPPPQGGVGKLCNPAAKDSVAAISPQPAGQGEAFTASPDENALSQCMQQILSRNQCGPYLVVKDIRQLSKRGAGNDAVLVAEVDLETIQEFEVRSDTAINCTGTWWREDPQFTRHQLSFPESKYFVKVGQLLTLRKTFTFQKNDFGWRCQVQSMKPVENAVVRKSSQ
jgi:hypothetical protein